MLFERDKCMTANVKSSLKHPAMRLITYMVLWIKLFATSKCLSRDIPITKLLHGHLLS